MDRVRDLQARFAAKYFIDTDSGCWLWMAPLRPDGYGQIAFQGRPALAHRISYQLHVGDIPEGLQIDHLCRVRRCVNPSHLEPVTQAVNKGRGERAMKTHCPYGHPYSGDNLRQDWQGRKCRECGRIRERLKYVRNGKLDAPALMAAKTHCPQGHPYNDQNTYLYITRSGIHNRQCRRCKYEWKHKHGSTSGVNRLEATERGNSK